LHSFPKIFLQQFLPHYSFVSGKIVSCVFFPIFWSRYPCEYKKRFCPLLRRFFSNIFCTHYSCVVLEILFRAFSPPLLGHDIRVNIKNVFCTFSKRLFSYIFCSHYSCVSEKIVSSVFFPAVFVMIFV